MIHRDLASRNVLVGPGPTVKITDFGLSRILDDQEDYAFTSGNMGPVKWMSPEALVQQKYSKKSDVWSFGGRDSELTPVLIWEILAKDDPWRGLSLPAVVLEVTAKRQTLALHPDWPQRLTNVMKECWHYEPSQRPDFPKLLVICSLMAENALPAKWWLDTIRDSRFRQRQ